MTWWPWLSRQKPAVVCGSTGHSPGTCELCSAYGMLCMDGHFLCWEHYSPEMALRVLLRVPPEASNENARR